MLPHLVLCATLVQAQEPVATLPPGMVVAERAPLAPFVGPYSARSSITWSAGGSLVACVATLRERWVGLVGSEVGTEHDFVAGPLLLGNRPAFWVADGAEGNTVASEVRVDRVTIAREDSFGDLFGSRDGRVLAYWSQPGALYGNAGSGQRQTHVLVTATVDERGEWSVRRGQEWRDGGDSILLSEDGALLLTTAFGSSGWSVITRRGKREKELSKGHASVGALAMSADGGEIAYVADDELFFKGRRRAKGLAGFGRVAVDPNGRHVAYAHATDTGMAVSVDEEKERFASSSHVLELAFAPEGERLAYVANAGGAVDPETLGELRGGEWWVVVRETEDPERLEPHPRFLEVRDLVWSPDGEALAYCARVDRGWIVIAGDRRSEPMDDVDRPHWSMDGTSVGFGARIDRELLWNTLELDPDE